MTATVIALLAVAMAACTQQPAGAPSPSSTALPPGLDARFDYELSLTLSDYSRGIIEDKRITNDEYQDADSRYVECVNDAFPGRVPSPFSATPQPGGQFSHSFAGDDADLARFDRMEPACLQEFMGGGAIDVLYGYLVKNPQMLPVDEVTLQCLVKKGLVDPDTYGIDQLHADAAADLDDGTGDGVTQPTDLDLSKGEAFDCWLYQG